MRLPSESGYERSQGKKFSITKSCKAFVGGNIVETHCSYKEQDVERFASNEASTIFDRHLRPPVKRVPRTINIRSDQRTKPFTPATGATIPLAEEKKQDSKLCFLTCRTSTDTSKNPHSNHNYNHRGSKGAFFDGSFTEDPFLHH